MDGKPQPVYEGTIRQDPAEVGKPLSIALLGCVLSTQHALEDNIINRVVPQERRFGRYEPENFNFPHSDIVANTIAHDPDFVFVAGDQYYEQNPTRVARDTPDADLDTLYRWQQWLVSFRDLVRDRPSVLLIDDHDVLQGNLWGNGGRVAPERDQNRGGYVWGIPLTQMVYRMQCGHNPDAVDPTPIDNDLPVSYTAFTYGGASIAVVEDRKWKTSAVQGEDMNVHRAELLGPRQEAFLATWKDMHPGKPKVLLSQSSWVCLQTDPEGRELTDFDSNGYPPLARYRATALAKAAGCVMLANDQHLPSLVRMGIDTHTDGPVQFVGPAGGSFWQRWFEPADRLDGARAGMEDRTGDWIDAFGNKIRVLAVANPKISFADFRKHNRGRSQAINDRALKSEGYGILRVDDPSRTFVFECWPWDKGPSDGDAAQYAGWPYTLSFDDV
nr:alkaline phosphatase D family protein [Tsuneonella dongtanensis]